MGLRTVRNNNGFDDELNAVDFTPEPSTGLLLAGAVVFSTHRRSKRSVTG